MLEMGITTGVWSIRRVCLLSQSYFHWLTGAKGKAAGTDCTARHSISDGIYELEYISLMPQSTIYGVVRCKARFVPDPECGVYQEFPSGLATTNNPHVIKGPIPVEGPGYFYFQFISQGTTQHLEAVLVYRRLTK